MAYALAPESYLSELVDIARFTAPSGFKANSGLGKMELYLTDSLKAARTATIEALV